MGGNRDLTLFLVVSVSLAGCVSLVFSAVQLVVLAKLRAAVEEEDFQVG